MPLSFHKFAEPAALAALAAGEQGKFWEFHDELFALSSKLTPDVIIAIATKLELDIDKFKKDMASVDIKQKLAQDLQDAKEAGVTGTPTLFVNGIRLKSRTLPAIQKIIDEELAQKAN